jgi:hypothetical protein
MVEAGLQRNTAHRMAALKKTGLTRRRLELCPVWIGVNLKKDRNAASQSRLLSFTNRKSDFCKRFLFLLF